MSPENAKKIREAARDAGDYLKGRLPDRSHLPARNSYAHVWERVKYYMGRSYKECDDDQVDEILRIIQRCKDLGSGA